MGSSLKNITKVTSNTKFKYWEQTCPKTNLLSGHFFRDWNFRSSAQEIYLRIRKWTFCQLLATSLLEKTDILSFSSDFFGGISSITFQNMKRYVITHQCLDRVSNWTLSPLNVSCKIWTYLNPSKKEMQSEEKGINRIDKSSLCTLDRIQKLCNTNNVFPRTFWW